MRIKMSFLLGPGSGRNTSEKFYIGIEDDRCANVIYGANSAGGSGTVKSHTATRSVERMIGQKLRAEYREVGPDSINEAAKTTVLDVICQAIPGLDRQQASWEKNAVVFSATQAGGATSAHPKRFKKVHGWF